MNSTFFPNKTGQFVSVHLPSASWFISGIGNWSARRVGPVQLAMEHYVYLVFFYFFVAVSAIKDSQMVESHS